MSARSRGPCVGIPSLCMAAVHLGLYAPSLIIGKRSWAPPPAPPPPSTPPSLVLVSRRSVRQRHAPREGDLQVARAGEAVFLGGVGRTRLMGSWLSSRPGSSSAAGEGSCRAPVVLNVYDLTTWNNYTYWCGVGIFHSGIEVHGLEYGFGAHDLPSSGVFEVEPRSCPGFMFRCSVLLGYTKMLPSEFRAFMENMALEYHGDTYHLISKNCNHFTDDICVRLTSKQIPGWVNRLASIGELCSCLLPESLQMPVVKHTPEYHVYSEDGSECLSVITANEPTESEDADQDKHLLSPSSGGEVAFIREVHR